MMKKLPLALCCLLAASACGEDEGDSEEGMTTAQIITVGGDYAGSGVLTTISLPSLEVTVNAVAGVVGGDPVIKQFGNQLFILDRFGGDTLTILDRELQLVASASTGAGSNPQDMVLVGNDLYIVGLGTAEVQVFDVEDIGAGPTASIDLSGLDEEDGLPDCNSIAHAGGNVFVSCQALNEDFLPRGLGQVAVIDVASNTLDSTLQLTAANPITWMESQGGSIYLATAPFYAGGPGDEGCIERISTGSTPAVECVVGMDELGDYVSDLHAVGDTMYFVDGAAFTTGTVRALSGQEVQTPSFEGVGGAVTGIASCPDGELVLADHSDGSRGIRVYGADGEALSDGALSVGWPTDYLPSNGTICW